VEKARNDLSAAVPKFCLALEEHRRLPEGRVRTSQEFLATFFPHDDKTCADKIFKYLPNEVRGPIIAAWGVRGIKAALRDTDEKVLMVMHDALVAGDVDHGAFEDALSPETLVRWLPLSDLWTFWRGGKLSKQALHKALATAYELYLFDARWFLDAIQAKGGSLRGTDVLADGLTKDELTQWVRRVHETGDGTPKGLIAALGWEKIVAKTQNDVLVAVIDSMVVKVGLAPATRESTPRLDGSKPDAKPAATASPKGDPGPPKADASTMVKPDSVQAKLEALSKTEGQNKAEATPKPATMRSSPPPPARPPLEQFDDGAWAVASVRPAPPTDSDAVSSSAPIPTEEMISVPIEEDIPVSPDAAIVTDRLPTSPRMRSNPPVPADDEDTEVKHMNRRSDRAPSSRGPSRR
jgi:hypothetical protein